MLNHQSPSVTLRFDAISLFHAKLNEHRETFEATTLVLGQPFLRTLAILKLDLQHGGKLMFFGNGESAAEAQQNHSLQDRPRMDRSRVLGDRHVDNDSARSITGPTGTFA